MLSVRTSVGIDKQNRLLLVLVLILVAFQLYSRTAIVHDMRADVASINTRMDKEVTERAKLLDMVNLKLDALEKKIDAHMLSRR